MRGGMSSGVVVAAPFVFDVAVFFICEHRNRGRLTESK